MTDDDFDLDRVIREAIQDSVWETPPVDREPVIRLSDWKVIEVSGELRLVGYHAAGFEGRLSSRIQRLDPSGKRVVTRSGRAYLLEGPAGSHPDADWVLDGWLHAQGKGRSDIRTVPLDEVPGRLAE